MSLAIDARQSLLLLVDYQQRLLPALSGGEAALANALRLARAARLFGVPAYATEQSPDKLGPNAPELAALVARTFAKTRFDACRAGLVAWIEPQTAEAAPSPQAARGASARSLPRHLRERAPRARAAAARRTQWLLAGCEAHICVLQTALGLLDAFADDEDDDDGPQAAEPRSVWVVTDACASRSERNRDAAFDRLAAAGCELVTTEMVLYEWLGDAADARMRELLALVK
jgi:nicotinamidase-related amidase